MKTHNHLSELDRHSSLNSAMQVTQRGVFPEITARSTKTRLPQKKKLVLDLDGTLIATFATEPGIPSSKIQMTIGGRAFTFFVVVREGLATFLSVLCEYYEIQLYTAGYKEFAEAVTREFDLDFYISKIFHREHCVRSSSGMYIKDLSLIGADPKSSILIDNNDYHSELQPLNTLVIDSFNLRENDPILINLVSFLISVSKKEDLRPINNHYEEYVSAASDCGRFAKIGEMCNDMRTNCKDKVIPVNFEEYELNDCDADRTFASKTTATIPNFLKTQKTTKEEKVCGFSPEVRKKIAEFRKTSVVL